MNSCRLRRYLIERLARRDIGVMINMEFRGSLDAAAKNRNGVTICARCRFRGFDEPGAFVRINDIMMTENKARESPDD